MKVKSSLTEKMKAKLSALKLNAPPSLIVRTQPQMAACYRAAEILEIKIERIANWAGRGWLVRRIS